MLYLAERSNEATRQALHFARDAMGAAGGVVYRVDRTMAPFDYTLSGVAPEFHRLYVEEMSGFDPLHVAKLVPSDCAVARLDEAGALMACEDFRKYIHFVESSRISNIVEFVFRRGGEVFAGMSLLWTDGVPLSGELAPLARRIHNYLEFNLAAAYPTGNSPRTIDRIGLTDRERQVVNLLCCGRTNQDIASVLGVGLPTVKTHLTHISTSSVRRTELPSSR